MRVNRLSARAVETIGKPGMHADGGGLYLAVGASGSKSWRFIWRSSSKRSEMGLGSFPTISLASARTAAQEARSAVARGENPIEMRRRASISEHRPTFREVMEEHLSVKVAALRNTKHRDQWRSTLESYALDLLPMPVADIGIEHVLKVLKPIWTTKPETASRVRGRIEAILNAAKAKKLRQGENPAQWRGHLSNLLPAKPKLSRGHFAAMPWKSVPAAMGQLHDASSMSALALQWIILTACRSNEGRGARWHEIDLTDKIWTVPAERTKTARAHRVPLADAAIEILERVALLKMSDDGLIFPGGRPESQLSDVAVTKALRRVDAVATVHGMRSAFRDWAVDCARFPREIAEAALAHVIGDATERAYRRGDGLEVRRELMEVWSRFLTAPGGRNVVELRHAKSGAA